MTITTGLPVALARPRGGWATPAAPPPPVPTIWGLDPVQLHDRFWAHRGVQVVRPGERQPLSDRAQLFLLTDERLLATVDSAKAFETLYWSSPDLVYVRVRERSERGYKERVITDDDDRFIRFERVYDKPVPRLMRAAFTPNRDLARAWQRAASAAAGWRRLRGSVPRKRRSTMTVDGSAYDRTSGPDLARMVKDLTRIWNGPGAAGPGAVIGRAREAGPGVWADTTADLPKTTRCVGPAWVGAGRTVDAAESLIGPVVLWDHPASRPVAPGVVWPERVLVDLPNLHLPRDPMTRRAARVHAVLKRGFDVAFSLFAIAMTIWLYPLIMLAIWIEDRAPIFFSHKRETRGGREFGCFKFRSMYRDAERRKQELLAKGQNQCDGPQFFMENDVRVTKVGKFLRATRLDELPQFFNVLLGHMSVVGPRPSPFKENQFCPAWREARLSVRPGITGLWQINRTRIAGQDFQEWIKYDIEYVENQSFSLDMLIIARTFWSFAGGLMPKFGRKRKD
ncbi:MAG: sugar transferase [Phycisphaerae bacterium]